MFNAKRFKIEAEVLIDSSISINDAQTLEMVLNEFTSGAIWFKVREEEMLDENIPSPKPILNKSSSISNEDLERYMEESDRINQRKAEKDWSLYCPNEYKE